MKESLRRAPRLWPTGFIIVLCGCSPGLEATFEHDATGQRSQPVVETPWWASFNSEVQFVELNDDGLVPIQSKFVVADFGAAAPSVSFLNEQMFRFHDEWYWFQLLNGIHIVGSDEQPLIGKAFHSVDEVYRHYIGTKSFDLDLVWYGSRIVSNRFYRQALGLCDTAACPPRAFGVGAILFFPADPARVLPDPIWAMELEYLDTPDEQLVSRFLSILETRLPPTARDGGLRWLARTSMQQESLARELRAGRGPLRSRVLTHHDLRSRSDVRSYNTGVAAGRIKRVRSAELASCTAGPNDIVILEDAPSDLGPVAGIVTTAPQVPLSNFTLRATARGTPSVYISNAFTDGELASLERDRVPVLLDVRPDSVRWRPLRPEEWQDWLRWPERAPEPLAQPGGTDAPYAQPLLAPPGPSGLTSLLDRLPLVGLKAAGVAFLSTADSIAAPFEPQVVTARAYEEFIAPAQARIRALLDDTEFRGDRRVRQLTLEGETRFRRTCGGDVDSMRWLSRFATSPHRKALWDILGVGGVVGLLSDELPIPDGVLSDVIRQLEIAYGWLSPSQGLRFRPSSTAEGLEGLRGAGAYDSATGFLAPDQAGAHANRKKTISAALRDVWTSYWTFGAFEEREDARIAHLDGRMAICSHPRFDDADELANGVFVLSIAQRGGARGTTSEDVTLTMNALPGATSLSGAAPGAVPEPETYVISGPLDNLAIRRTGPQPLERAAILTDHELIDLQESTTLLARDWLDVANARLSPGRRASSMRLVFDFRKVKAGSPSVESGPTWPERIVLTQVRPLTRSGGIPQRDLGVLEVPTDVLEGASLVERVECRTETFSAIAYEVTTDPALDWLEWSSVPFLAQVRLRALSGDNPLSLRQGEELVFSHEATRLGRQSDLGFSLVVVGAPGSPLDEFTLSDGGEWSIVMGGQVATGIDAECTHATVVRSRGATFAALFDQP